MASEPNFRQALYQNYLGMSPAQLSQIAGAVSSGAAPPPSVPQASANAQLSPNMVMYLQNLAKPSVYNQGLPAVPTPTQKPVYDPTSAYNNLLNQYSTLEQGVSGSGVPAAIQNLLNNGSNDDKLTALQQWMAGNKADTGSGVALRTQEYNLLNDGLNKINKNISQSGPQPFIPTLTNYNPILNTLW